MIIGLAEKKHAREIALIHKQEIGAGFLSSLPLAFLESLYAAIIQSPASFCIVAVEKDMVVGFIAGTMSVKDFYKFFLKKYFFYSFSILFLKLLRFSQLKKMVETLLYPVKETKSPKAELLTMAVKRELQGRGIAASMFVEFVAQVKARGIQEFKVLVGGELKPAIKFYEKSGFVFLKDISIHDNKKTRIYVYHIQ